ncbi:MAG: hypothetical protein DMG13_02335 [Acidobacteria bacterium]|nr:MAG: hypothetical protein DMG13_02335 [Acidobacteriota bacterium]
MTICRIDPLSDPRWNAFLETHRDASIFHTSSWLEALRRSYGYEPVVYAVTGQGGELVSGVPFCLVKSHLTGRRLVSLPFSDYCQPLVGNSDELKELLAAAKEDAKRQRCKYVEIRPLVSDESSIVAATELAKNKTALVHRLDLNRNQEDVARGFHKQCVRNIARCFRNDLVYEEGRSEDLLRKFYRLLLLTRRRHMLPPQPLSWFRNLADCLGDRLKVRVASKDGTAIASIVTLSFKDVITYKYGCSDTRFNTLQGTSLLFWRTIQDAWADGATVFDLGRSDLDNPGLIAFKDHWGAARSDLIYYRYQDAAKKDVSSAPAKDGSSKASVKAAAKRLLTLVPDPIFTALGGFLYRHAG